MPLQHCLMKALLLVSVSISVSSCATVERTRISSPNASAFRLEPKPVPSIDILRDNSGEAYRQHQRDKDDWGERGWARVNDLCLWFAAQGVEGLPCMEDAATIQR